MKQHFIDKETETLDMFAKSAFKNYKKTTLLPCQFLCLKTTLVEDLFNQLLTSLQPKELDKEESIRRFKLKQD